MAAQGNSHRPTNYHAYLTGPISNSHWEAKPSDFVSSKRPNSGHLQPYRVNEAQRTSVTYPKPQMTNWILTTFVRPPCGGRRIAPYIFPWSKTTMGYLNGTALRGSQILNCATGKAEPQPVLIYPCQLGKITLVDKWHGEFEVPAERQNQGLSQKQCFETAFLIMLGDDSFHVAHPVHGSSPSWFAYLLFRLKTRLLPRF